MRCDRGGSESDRRSDSDRTSERGRDSGKIVIEG